jgi:hypothetical protein
MISISTLILAATIGQLNPGIGGQWSLIQVNTLDVIPGGYDAMKPGVIKSWRDDGYAGWFVACDNCRVDVDHKVVYVPRRPDLLHPGAFISNDFAALDGGHGLRLTYCMGRLPTGDWSPLFQYVTYKGWYEVGQLRWLKENATGGASVNPFFWTSELGPYTGIMGP